MPRHPLVTAMTALALAGTIGCAALRPKGDEGQPVVRSVRIDGAHRVSEDEVKRHLATGETGRWPWSKLRRFDPVLWDQDLRRIPRIYEARGLYGARVLGVHVDERADGVHLRVLVEEAEPTRVASLEVTGLDGVPDGLASRVRGGIRLRVGDVFREGEWEDAKAHVERTLRDGGYADAAAGGEARVDVARRTAAVRLEIAPGTRYRLGELYLVTSSGRPFPIEPVLDHARALLPAGIWFSQSRLAAAQRRLFDLGIFDAVDVSAASARPGSDELPVVVDVREAPLVSSRLGAGAGASPSRSEVRAVAEWTHRNFGGDLRVLHAEARAGWAFLPSFWGAFQGGAREPRRDGPFGFGALDLAQPRFLGAPTVEVFGSTELERDLREAYTFRSVRLKAGAGWHATAQVDARALGVLDVYALSDTPLLGGGAPEPAYGCAPPCRLAFIEQEVTFGRRLAYREETRGPQIDVRLREGVPTHGVPPWLEAAVDARTYRPLSSRVVLAARVAAATVVPLRDEPVPIMERLFSGGAAMRGYGGRWLAPLLLVTDDGETQALPTGGKGLLEASLEARFSVGSALGLAAFLDAGSVTPASFDPVAAVRALQFAPGVGVRYRSALGPLRADLATTLPWGPSLPTSVLPGATVDPAVARSFAGHGCCAVHISVGEAF